MATMEMPKSTPCLFDKGGWAPCKEPTTNGWCDKHENAKCASCGEHAVRSCDAQMGGLGCGSHLCETCRHAEGGRHVKADVARQLDDERRRLEKEGVESERMLAERGLSPDPTRPKNLNELLSGSREGYEIKEIFSLELEHTSMGYFPSIFVEPEKRIIVTTDASLIFRVWETLEPRDSILNVNLAWVSENLGVCYPIPREMGEYFLKKSTPMRLLTSTEHDELTRDGKQPYKWAFGLLGGGTNKVRFREIIEKTAKQRGVALPANTP